jgi:hypothetical protein
LAKFVQAKRDGTTAECNEHPHVRDGDNGTKRSVQRLQENEVPVDGTAQHGVGRVCFGVRKVFLQAFHGVRPKLNRLLVSFCAVLGQLEEQQDKNDQDFSQLQKKNNLSDFIETNIFRFHKK